MEFKKYTLKRRAFSFLNDLNRIQQMCSWLYLFINFFQFLSISILLLKQHLIHIQLTHSFFQTYDNIMLFCLGLGPNYFIFSLVNLIILGILSISFSVYIYLCAQTLQFNYNKKILNILVNGCFILFNFLEFIVVQSTASFSQSIKDWGYQISIFVLAIYFLNYFAFSSLNSHKRLFKDIMFPSLLIVLLAPFVHVYLIFSIISGILLMFDNQNHFKKILYGQLAGISLWVYLGKVTTQFIDGKIPNFIILYGGFILVVSFILTFLLEDKLKWNSKQRENTIIFNIVSTLKYQNVISSIKYKQLLKIYYILRNFIQQSKTQCHEADRKGCQICKKSLETLTKQDIIYLLKLKVIKQIQNQKEIQLKILLIKLKIIQKTPALQIIQDVEQLMQINQNQLGYLQQYRLFQFTKFIEAQIFKSKSEHLKTSIIVQISNLTQKFYNSLSIAFEKLIDFWTLMSKDKISKRAIVLAYIQIQRQEATAKQCLQKMGKFGHIKKQQQMLALLMKFINGYRQIREPTNQIFISEQNSKKLESMNYIILQQNKIIRTSFTFTKQFSSNGMEYYGMDKCILFTDAFSKYLDQEIKSMSAIQERILNLPVILDQKLLIKKCKVFFYPQLEGKIKYLITFQNYSTYNDTAMILYHSKGDSIQNFNDKFTEFFNLNQTSLRDRIINSKLLSSQIFAKVDLSNLQSLEALKDKKTLNCDLIVKKFKTSGQDKYKINVSLVEHYEISNDNYYLFTLRKGYFIKTQAHISGQKVSVDLTNNLHGNNQKNLAKIYQNQTFFCRISNPYQNKITQKQSQLQLPRRNMLFYISWLFGIAILALIVQIFVFSYNKAERMTSYKQFNAAVWNVNKQYQNIFGMYYSSFKLNYLNKYPQQWNHVFGSEAPSIVDQIKTYYIGYIDSDIKQFLNTYLVYINKPPNSQISYSIQFSNFNVTTSSYKTTLIDFTQNFRLFESKNQSLDFLLNNYGSFRDITIQFQQNYTYHNFIDQQFISAYDILIVTSIFIGFLSALSCFLLLRIQNSINFIYSLLAEIQKKDIKSTLKAIMKQKQKIKFIKTRSQLMKIEGQKDNFSVKVDQQNTNSERNLKSQNQLSDIQDKDSQRVGSMEQLPINQPIKQAQPLKKQIQEETYIFIVIRNAFFFIISITIGGILLHQINNIQKQKQNITYFFDYEKDIFHTMMILQRMQSDTFFKPTFDDYFNTSIDISDKLNSVEMSTYFQNPLPSGLQQSNYKKKEGQILYGNICNLNISLALEIPGMKCQDYLNGMLIYGFAQAYESFFLMIKSIQSLKLSQFITEPCSPCNCSQFLQLIAARFYLNSVLQMNLLNFQTAMSQAILTFHKNIIISEVIYFSMILGMVIIFVIWIKILDRRGKMTIWLFNVIPPQIMMKMKTTTFIRKQNILQKLDNL